MNNVLQRSSSQPEASLQGVCTQHTQDADHPELPSGRTDANCYTSQVGAQSNSALMRDWHAAIFLMWVAAGAYGEQRCCVIDLMSIWLVSQTVHVNTLNSRNMSVSVSKTFYSVYNLRQYYHYLSTTIMTDVKYRSTGRPCSGRFITDEKIYC